MIFSVTWPTGSFPPQNSPLWACRDVSPPSPSAPPHHWTSPQCSATHQDCWWSGGKRGEGSVWWMLRNAARDCKIEHYKGANSILEARMLICNMLISMLGSFSFYSFIKLVPHYSKCTPARAYFELQGKCLHQNWRHFHNTNCTTLEGECQSRCCYCRSPGRQ